MPRHQLAAVHELARIALLSTVPGETLGKLAERMQRIELEPGESVEAEPDDPRRFCLVLNGMLTAGGRMLRDGDSLGGADPFPTARAMVPSTVACCDGETFDAYIKPLAP